MTADNVAPLIAVLGGLLSFLSPCVLPIVPAYIGLVAGSLPQQKTSPLHAAKNALPGAFAFVLGFSLLFSTLGSLAAAAAPLFGSFRSLAEIIAGSVLILFGLHLLRIVPIPLLNRVLSPPSPKHNPNRTPAAKILASFLAGIAFGGAWTPCIGPVLAAVLTLAASQPSPAHGALLLGFYSLGLGVPFLIAAAATHAFLNASAKIKRRLRTIEIISGSLLILTGVLVVTGNLTVIANALIKLFPSWALLG